MVGWIWNRAAISDVAWSPLRAARATLDLNDALYCAFLAHDSPPCGDDESELRHLAKFWVHFSAGQGVSVINDFPSAEEIVARMKIEYDEAFTKLRNKR